MRTRDLRLGLRLCGGLVAAFFAALIGGPLSAQEPASSGERIGVDGRSVSRPTAADPGFQAILWMRGGTPSEATLARVRELGFDAVSVGRSQSADAVREAGLRLYGDQVAGKGILELRDSQWNAWREAFLRTRSRAASARPSCLADEVVLDRLAELTSDGVKRLLDEGVPADVLGVSLADEASALRRSNPMDAVASATYQRAFRRWMIERCGGSVAALELRWGVSSQTFDGLEAWSTDAARARAYTTRSLPKNLAPFADRLAFEDQLFASAVGRASAAVEATAAGLPSGLFGMQPPCAFGGHDYRLLMPWMTLYEAYDLGGARDLASCFQGSDARFLQTIFPVPSEGPARLPRAAWSSALAHGASGVIVWSSNEVFEDDRYAGVLRATDRDLEPAAEHFAGARVLRDRLWIVESRPSTFAWWMLDSDVDGDRWTERLTSYETENGTSVRARVSWIQLCNDLGYQPRHVDQRDLVNELRRSPPRVLVLAACLALGDPELRAITEFVRAGGTVIADHSPALYDLELRLRERGGLDGLFGVEQRSLDRRDLLVRNAEVAPSLRFGNDLPRAERELRITGRDPGVVPTNHVRSLDSGRAVYLNLAVCEYADWREGLLGGDEPKSVTMLRQMVASHFTAAGLKPSVECELESGEGPLERIHLRSPSGQLLLAVRLDRAAAGWRKRLARGDGIEADQLHLRFRGARTFRDLLTGERYDAVETCSLPFDPFAGVFLLLE